MDSRNDIALHRPVPRFLRVLAAVLALLFALQLVGASAHKHAAAERGGDCAACLLAHHVPAPAGPAPVVQPPAAAAVAYVLPARPAVIVLAQENYLIPAAQAPPATSSC